MSRSWRLAPSLAQLRDEINTRWPARSKRSDGTIGDTAHQASRSEHNPDSDGIVRAIDITTDGINVQQLLDATIGDDRVHYVIHNRSIWSRAHGWRKRPYTGPNPHTSHVHISIRNATSERAPATVRAKAATDTRVWLPVVSSTHVTKGILAMDINQPVPGTEKLSTDGKPLTAGQCLLRGAWAYQQTINTGSIAKRLRRVEALVKARTSPTGEARAQYAYDTVTGDDSLVARIDALEAALMESDDDLTGI